MLPRRVSYVLSAVIVGWILLMIVNGILAKQALNAAGAVFLEMDEFID